MCFVVDDYAQMFQQKTVKCRKPHRCDGCGRVIAKGETAEYFCGKFEGDFFACYECEQCRRLILSIAAEEIRHGCHWNEAWCPLDELQEYIAERQTPLPMLQGSLEECWQEVNRLWNERRGN